MKWKTRNKKVTHISGAKHSRIHEMNQAVVFGEIILDRCAGQQNAAFGFQTHERAVRLIFTIFQAMSFIAQQQPNFGFIQNV